MAVSLVASLSDFRNSAEAPVAFYASKNLPNNRVRALVLQFKSRAPQFQGAPCVRAF